MTKRNATLLIVDDEIDITKIVSKLMEMDVTTILTATNGKDALEIFDKNQVDCILSDINMPIMNGIEFVKEIRKRNLNVPFIFYTGYGTKRLMVEALKYGAFDFINKPELDNLVEIVCRGVDTGLAIRHEKGSNINDKVPEDSSKSQADKDVDKYIEMMKKFKLE